MDVKPNGNGRREWMGPGGILAAATLIGGFWALVISPMMANNDRLERERVEESKQIDGLSKEIRILEANQVRLGAAISADSEMKFQRVDEVYALTQVIWQKTMPGSQLPPHTPYMNVNPELKGYTGTGQ